MGRTGRGYDLDDVAIVPSRRTRTSTTSPPPGRSTPTGSRSRWSTQPVRRHRLARRRRSRSARLGGLGVLDGEGLWARYEDPQPVIDELRRGAAADDRRRVIAALQEVYSEPVSADLLIAAIKHDARRPACTVAVRLSPQQRRGWPPTVDRRRRRPAGHPGHDRLRRARAGHTGDALNLKSFIADLDVPVIVGGCTELPDRHCT